MKTQKPTNKTKVQLLSRIIKTRGRLGLSVNQAAKMSSISQPTWCRVESGVIAPTFETLFDMSSAVGLDITIQVT